MKTNNKVPIKIIVEGALMIAIATILSYIKFFNLPQGGAITIEMLPIVIMGFRHGSKWGCFTGFVHGLLQMIIGFQNVMYCATLLSQIGCILLDYLIAFAVLGLSGLFMAMFKNKVAGATVAAVICGALRFICSFLSGYLLWGSYAPEGMNPAYYSLVYNGSYMLPNTIILAVICAILAATAPKIFLRQNVEA